MHIDISGTDAAKRAVKASRVLNSAYMGQGFGFSMWAGGGFGGGAAVASASSIEHLRKAYKVEQTLAEIKDWQLQVLHGCLRGLGYRQIALTPTQRAELKRLRLRSDRRHAYLHSLASNPMAVSTLPI